MRNKRLLRTLSALCLTLVLASGFTAVSYTHLITEPILCAIIEQEDMVFISIQAMRNKTPAIRKPFL